LVTSAWPYIYHVPHLGNIIGSILSADVLARYYRLKGHEVLFVSGSDEHGTPIEVEAVRLGVHPKQLTDKNHALIVELFRRWGISFDNYTRTESPIHKEFVQKFFMKIYENGYIFTRETELPYCPNCKRFLPDRFVEGTCPYCGYEAARGDQCEKCGRLLEPAKLINPHCVICKSTPIVRKAVHWYFDLPRFADKLLEYIEGNRQLPENARNFSLSLIREGLKPRAVTRDNKWGIPAPFPGAEGKTIYVWVEAVLGYISATIEYFKRRGMEDRWKDYWFDRDTKTLYFIGKDNIPFHTIIFPALLLATHEGYNLPWNVVSTEFLLFEGKKFSKRRRIGVWIDEALELFPADYWRYVLLSTRPETKDTSFTWDGFIEKVNADLNDTLGNFIHRALTFVNQYFGGRVPQPTRLSEGDQRILQSVQEKVEEASRNLEEFKIQAALRSVIEISRIGNRYLNQKEPWKAIKTNPEDAANTIYVCVQLVKCLAVTLEPFLPFTAEKVWRLLNLPGSVHEQRWDEALKPIPSGHKIHEAKPLFRKVGESPEELQAMLEKIRSKPKTIPYEEFSKLDLRVGRIVEAEPIPKSKHLIKLTIDLGGGQLKQAVAGISRWYRPEELKGRQVAVVANLEPRTIFGVRSEVMILAAQDGQTVSILQPDRPVKPGSQIK